MISSSEARTVARDDRDWHPILSDHRALGALSEQLENLLGDLAAEGSFEGGAVGRLLVEFRRRLFAHLDAEEKGGVLERAASIEPRLARRVEQLSLEHHELRQSAAVLATGPDSGDSRADWVGFHVRFAAFRDFLQEHEQAENDVLHSAYKEDIGGG